MATSYSLDGLITGDLEEVGQWPCQSLEALLLTVEGRCSSEICAGNHSPDALR